MAKEAEVVAVRILDCTGSGTISDTVAALDWVAGAAPWGWSWQRPGCRNRDLPQLTSTLLAA
jgi:hypothetical protein